MPPADFHICGALDNGRFCFGGVGCPLPSYATLKEKPQVPNPRTAIQGARYGITWERTDAETPHYRGVYDDAGRLMAIFCHNTDLGDGWEEESRNEWYFKVFSEPKAYPMGINIIFYSMTH